MNERIRANSANLQEVFPEVYADFFAKSSVAVSVPCVFRWSGEFSMMFGGPATLQKLPLRVYMGLELTSKPGITIGSFKIYDAPNKLFKNANDVERISIESAIDFILENPNELPAMDVSGFKLHVISEIPYGHGLNRSDVIAAGLVSLFYVNAKKLKKAEINSWKTRTIKQLIVDENSNLIKIHRFSWKLNSIYQGDVSSGGCSFASLVPSKNYPLLYCTEKRGGTIANHPKDCLPASTLDNLDIIDSTKFWAENFEEIFDLPALRQWPFDFALIFTGTTRPILNYVKAAETIRSAYDQVANFTLNEMDNLMSIEDRQAKKVPFFYKLAQKEHGWGYWNACLEMTSASATRVIRALEMIFRRGPLDRETLRLTESINQCQSIVAYLNRFYTKETYKHPAYEIKDKIKEGLGEYAAIKMTSIDYMGDFLLVAGYDTIRDELEKIIADTKKETEYNLFTEYLSWVDGFENEGLQIEQDLSEGIYSKYIKRGSMKVKHFNKGIHCATVVREEKLEESKEEIDVLLDAVEEKIYIQGQPISSKELHSQTTTIELLRQLIESENHHISNSEMRRSSYSTNRNELQSKILTPFSRLIERRTGKRLSIKINGGFEEFNVRMEPSDVKMCIVERVF